jgi:methionyl-tRNA formyltransferase
MGKIIKIIVFTYKCSHCAEILKACKQSGIQISAIIIEKRPIRSIKEELINRIRRDYREVFYALLHRIKQRFITSIREEWRTEKYYRAFSNTVITVGDFNGSQCEHIVTEIAPDIIVLGGSRIIRSNIIKIPKIGILNAHPGLLPEYRGVDVIPWALINSDDMGVTVHFVDQGVDTGDICVQEKLPLMKKDSIPKLEKRAEVLAGKLMVKVLQSITKFGKYQTIENQKEKGKQYYKMDPNNLIIAEQKLQAMLMNDK